MNVSITPSILSGSINPPPSKSIMQRAVAAAYLKGGSTVILNAGTSDDDIAALNIIRSLGANVKQVQEGVSISVNRNYRKDSYTINCGESGLASRMFIPVVALLNARTTVEGEGSLLTRPFTTFEAILPLLGVDCKLNNGYLPAVVTGALQPTNITVDGSLSSQFITGLMMAYAGYYYGTNTSGASTISIINATSKSYIDLTEQILEEFQLARLERKGYETISFYPAASHEADMRYRVEADWSAVAIMAVAAAIAGDITIMNVNVNSLQGDKAIVDVLNACGALCSYHSGNLIVSSKGKLLPFDYDATDTPDLFPPLAALAAICEGTSSIKGVSRLVHKESNRALALQQEFARMGVTISIKEDVMTVQGAVAIKGAEVDSHGDHRIAMACALVALKAGEASTIINAEAVNKSYPSFFDDLVRCGVRLSLSQ